MNAEQEQPSSLLTQALRWLGAFDKAMNSQPVDLLERRVAELERQLSARVGAGSDGRPLRAANASEV